MPVQVPHSLPSIDMSSHSTNGQASKYFLETCMLVLVLRGRSPDVWGKSCRRGVQLNAHASVDGREELSVRPSARFVVTTDGWPWYLRCQVSWLPVSRGRRCALLRKCGCARLPCTGPRIYRTDFEDESITRSAISVAASRDTAQAGGVQTERRLPSEDRHRCSVTVHSGR